MRTKNVFTLVLFASVIVTGGAFAAQNYESASPELQPDPIYAPEEVVRIQIDALGKNDEPYEDAGIEITFRFASPQNKLTTGPLPHFVGIVRSPAYVKMINHSHVEFGPVHIEEDMAQVPVLITASDGEKVGYVFRLSRQSKAPYEQCWMTDGVVPIPVKNASGIEL